MTRKRFVRLVMAARHDRSAANRLADDVHKRGLPYATVHKALEKALVFLSVIQISGASISIQIEATNSNA